MPPTIPFVPGLRLVTPLAVAAVTLVCVAGAGVVQAQTVTCGVGQEVQAELGGGKGTIAEVGSVPPHVGWYRVVYTWNAPNGDWYDPKSWKLYAAGSTSRCQAPQPAGARKPVASASGTPGASPTPGASRSADRAPAPPSPTTASRTPAALKPGSYSCSAGAAGSFPIVIKAGGTYVDRAGKSGRFSLDAASAIVTFSSGSLAGQHSKVLGPGKFGLSSVAAKNFSVVCNLR